MRRRARLGAGVAAVLALVTLGIAQPLAAQPLPAHPRELRFVPQRFEVPDAAPYRHVLGNGVVVYVVEDHALPLVDVAVALRAGDYLDSVSGEKPKRIGVAGLTAAMLLRGGTEKLAPDAFDERVDFLGAQLSATAGSLRAGASLSAPAWVLEEALDLFFDMLRTPRFDAARLEVARGNLLESFRQRNDDPLAVLNREWRYLLYGEDHFLSRQLTAQALGALRREDLIEFHRRTWHPGGMVVAVSGDVDAAALLAGLERRFAGWKVGATAPWPPPAPTHAPVPGLYHVEKALPQGKVAIGHLSFQRRGWNDPDSFAATVMSDLLGGSGPSSRITGRVRTVEGLAYRASASLGVGDHFPGEFRIHLESKNESVALAAKLALEEVERLRRAPPVAEELRQIQRSIVDSFPYLFDSAEEIAGYFAEDELLGRPHTFWRDYRARIEAVTPEDVRRVAESVLHPDRTVILVVGPWREIEPGDPGRRASMRDFYGGAVRHLPERDPMTLEARP